MKQGKKPTRKQKIAIKEARLNPDNWLVVKDLSHLNTLEIVHRNTGTIRKIPA